MGYCADNSFSTATVNYAAVIPFKRRLLDTAWGKLRALK